MKSSTRAKGPMGRADELFSRIVRTLGYCENCGATDNLQCAHILSRSYRNTRCVEANAFCLCAGCHIYYTNHPIEFTRFVFESRGEPTYDWLRELSREPQKWSKARWLEVVAALRDRLNDLERAV